MIYNSLIKYGSDGKNALKKHSNKEDHKNRIAAVKNTLTLPSSLKLGAQNGKLCVMPYGAASNIHNKAQCNSRMKETLPKMVAYEDRLAHNEAFLFSFLVGHGLPFTMAPNLIEFPHFMAKDSKVLGKIKMSRTTAVYKLKEGLASTVFEDIVEVLKST